MLIYIFINDCNQYPMSMSNVIASFYRFALYSMLITNQRAMNHSFWCMIFIVSRIISIQPKSHHQHQHCQLLFHCVMLMASSNWSSVKENKFFQRHTKSNLAACVKYNNTWFEIVSLSHLPIYQKITININRAGFRRNGTDSLKLGIHSLRCTHRESVQFFAFRFKCKYVCLLCVNQTNCFFVCTLSCFLPFVFVYLCSGFNRNDCVQIEFYWLHARDTVSKQVYYLLKIRHTRQIK